MSRNQLRWLLADIALILFLWATSQGVFAHDSWINRQELRDPATGQACCGERDCEDLNKLGIKVSITAAGYQLHDTGEVVPFSRAIPRSPDGHYWRCPYSLSEQGGEAKKMARCLIVPPPST